MQFTTYDHEIFFSPSPGSRPFKVGRVVPEGARLKVEITDSALESALRGLHPRYLEPETSNISVELVARLASWLFRTYDCEQLDFFGPDLVYELTIMVKPTALGLLRVLQRYASRDAEFTAQLPVGLREYIWCITGEPWPENT